MKNQLIPITRCDTTSSEFEPSLVSENFSAPKLVNTDGALRVQECGDFYKITFRNDLMGLVHRVGNVPIIQTVNGGLYAIKNPDNYVLAAAREQSNA